MKSFFALLTPCIFFLSFAYALHKKVRVYDSFTNGVKQAIPLVVSIFPYIAAVTMLTKLLEVSGLNIKIADWLSPLFHAVGVPKEIAALILVKPLSGSGSIAVLTEILDTYGVDSYAAKCACVLCGASETVFYIGAVYFAGIKRKKINFALGISLLSYLASVVLACFLCNFLLKHDSSFRFSLFCRFMVEQAVSLNIFSCDSFPLLDIMSKSSINQKRQL